MRSLPAALLLALLLTACGGSESERADALPLPGVSAFTLGVDLWLREDGAERLLVQPEPGRQVFSPAISPDGRRIAFVRYQLTGGEQILVGSSLILVDQDGETTPLIEHDMKSEFYWYPRWSADGRSLIYTSEAPQMEISIEQIELATSEVRVLRTRARDGDLSPDGKRLVFVNDPYGGSPRLMVRELDSGREYLLDPNGDWPMRVFRIPKWSPDGRFIYFAGSVEPSTVSRRAVARTNGPEDIWRVAAEGGEPRLIAALTEDQPDFALSIDGRHMLARGAFGVYLIETDTAAAPFAIAPGEFHGWHDWQGRLSEEQWRELTDRPADSP